MGRIMTWPEYLDLILATLAQAPWSWVLVGVIAGVILGMTLVILAAVMVMSGDAQCRDTYYEDHIIGGNNG